MNQRKQPDHSKTVLVFTIGWVSILVFFTLFYYSQTPRWEALASPPAPIVELLPPHGGIRVLADDGTIYVNPYWWDESQSIWKPQEEPASSLNDSLWNCDIQSLPNSRLGPHPPNVRSCSRTSVYLPSFLLLDEQNQLWVWEQSDRPIFLVLVGGTVLILAFTFFSTLLIVVKSFNRRHPEITVVDPESSSDNVGIIRPYQVAFAPI